MTDYLSRDDVLWIAFLTNASKETKERLQNWTAADVQPVRHGQWTWNSNAPHREHGAYKCSNCGCHSDFEENYCYNCGADMRNE